MRALGALALAGALATSGGCRHGAAAGPAPAAAPSASAPSTFATAARTDLLGGAGLRAFQPVNEVKKVVVTTVPVTGQPFSEALHVDVKEGSGHEWAVQLEASNAAAVAAGDALLASFFLRTDKPHEDGPGETELVFELGKAPYSKSVSYPVQAGPDWVKVQVRFKATQAYAAGEAHLIFRLGYDPEIIELGDIKIENFARALALSALPATQPADHAREQELAAKFAPPVVPPGTVVEGGTLHIDVSPGQVLRPISPYVYGVNAQKMEDEGATVRRMGGNRQTAYNWELDLSNAGKDFYHMSDPWACTSLGYSDCGKPAAQFVAFAEENRKAQRATVATVPMVDYVTGDKGGPVREPETAPSKRWVKSLPSRDKVAPFPSAPDLDDGVVYQDEFVHYLIEKLGNAKAGRIGFYSLDNEPALWSETHPRVHPKAVTYRELIQRTEATAAAITQQDPTALVLGGVMYGWSEYMSLQHAADAEELNATYGTYLDYFLAEMKRLEAVHQRRLVHVLDLHWYPEARGAKRVTERGVSPKTVAARVQAPRSLWDPTYTEKSWVAANWGKPLRLVPWLQERIAERYAGTKLGFTEYNFGAGGHISGGLAEADALGVFGREGVYLANYWGDGAGNGKLPPYIRAAFQLFRNYDGKNGAFGDMAVAAAPVDQNKGSVFAATDSHKKGRLTILVINKSQAETYAGQIELHGTAKGPHAKQAAVYGFDGTSSDIRALGTTAIKDHQIAYRLPPLSATLFVCE